MRKEVKDLIFALAVIIPVAAFLFVWWFNCPVYREMEAGREMIRKTIAGMPWMYPEEVLQHYGITSEDMPAWGDVMEAQSDNASIETAD